MLVIIDDDDEVAPMMRLIDDLVDVEEDETEQHIEIEIVRHIIDDEDDEHIDEQRDEIDVIEYLFFVIQHHVDIT